jgi:signal transduction histidine kinase
MRQSAEKSAGDSSVQGTAELSQVCPLRRSGNPADGNCPEELLRQFQQLQTRYDRCAQSLATAAHDLRTPLAIIYGYIELLLTGKLGPLTEKQRSVLDDMLASSSRLKNLISDFLTFTGLQTGNLEMRFEIGNLNACLAEVCSFWSPRFQEKGVAFYFLENEKVEPFPFDYERVQRVMSNLLENALKFTPAGGTVWLHCEPHMWERRAVFKPSGQERRRRSMEAPNAVRISVADTGPGIPPEFHQEIFNDFFQVPEDSNNNPGMGLGLGIARRLIQAHRGKIWVESESGSGSKFCVLLPLKQI